MVRTMYYPRKSRSVDADRISQLLEHILHHILSYVPIKDAVRTSTLSKEWKRVCTSYNIYTCLSYDHNSFALQLLLSSDAIGQDPDVCEIRDKFMDFVLDNLRRISQQKSPVLRLSLDVAVLNDEFSGVDELMHLVGKIKVEELCITVQAIDSPVCTEWEKTLEGVDELMHPDVCYEFPYPTVLASNWLESLTIRWCKFPATAAGTFSSLRQLWLEQVMLSEESLSTLGSCCPEIESIDFDYCSFWFDTLKLSKFPKLKKVAISQSEFGLLNNVDTTETNLEEFIYESYAGSYWVTSPAACRNIRELELYKCPVTPPSLFEDFTTAFPLIEKLHILSHLSIQGVESVDCFKATTHYHLRSLHIFNSFLQKLYVDCPNLRDFILDGAVSEEIYINCPKLRNFQFLVHDPGNIPKVISINLPTALWFRFDFEVYSDLDTSWFISLKKFIEQIGGHKSIWLSLRVSSKMVQFVLDEFEATPISHLKHVHLELDIENRNRKDIGSIAAFVDGLFWATYPNTLTIQGYHCFDAVKYLCGRLADMKPQNESCCELQLCNKYWWHNMEDFEVMQENKGMTVNSASVVEMVEMTQTKYQKIKCDFRFQWCTIEETVARHLVGMQS